LLTSERINYKEHPEKVSLFKLNRMNIFPQIEDISDINGCKRCCCFDKFVQIILQIILQIVLQIGNVMQV